MIVEKRSGGIIQLEGETDRAVSGYAHKYGTTCEYRIYSWAIGAWTTIREMFEPGAFDNADMSSIYFRHNHDKKARGLAHPRNGTLKVVADENGLKYSAILSDTQAGRDLFTDVKSGLTTEMSFAFTLDDEDEDAVEYKRLNDELIERRIKKVKKLYDISTVDFPAYPDTSVEAKALEDGSKDIEERNGFGGLNNFMKNEVQEQKDNAKLELEKQKLRMQIDLEI